MLQLNELFKRAVSGVIQPDISENPPVKIPELKLADNHANLKNLVGEMMRNQTNANTVAAPLDIPLSAPVKKTIVQPLSIKISEAIILPEATPIPNLGISQPPLSPNVEKQTIVTEPNHLLQSEYEDTVEEKKYGAVATEMQANLAKLDTLKSIPEIPSTVTKNTENPDQIETSSDDNLILGGRNLVGGILVEFNDLLTAGKELETFLAKHKVASGQATEAGAALENARLARTAVAKSMTDLFTVNENPELDTGLEKAIEAFDAYSKAAVSMAQVATGKTLTENNSFLMLINAKKAQIKKLTEKIGGVDVFGKMKEAIKICETSAKNAINKFKSEGGVTDATAQMIVRNVVNTFIQDPKGMEMFASTGDIVGVMMHLFGPTNLRNTIETFNVNTNKYAK